MRHTLALLLAASFFSLCVAPVPAEEAEEVTSLKDAFKKGEFHLGFRYRFEAVDDDAVPRDGEASTLRTALTLKTAPFKNFRAHLEVENVTVVGDSKSFRNAGAGDKSNGVTDRATVADVAQTEFNQAYVEYAPGNHALKLGRREIMLEDQRLVGAVAWRQNHQSFDVASIEGKLSEKMTWSYAFLGQVHRIFGDSRDMTTHLLAGRYDFGQVALRGYALELDYDEAVFAGGSTRTFGAEALGSWVSSERTKLLYELELAKQGETGSNPRTVDAGYVHLMLGGGFGKWTAKAGLEVLEGSAEKGRFSTPLATLHKFNGWADKFLSTPVDGLEDLYLSVGYKSGPWNAAAIYHQFDAESASTDYGSEIDLLLTWKSGWGQLFAFKAADYSAKNFSADTTKWMVWSVYTF